jgi:hypothetical protein
MKSTKTIFTLASFIIAALITLSSACSSGNPPDSSKSGAETPSASKDQPAKTEKGIGEIMHVELTSPLNDEMIHRGKGIYDMKCSACHKLTADKLVGPGWLAVTSRRSPEWIMNMITNTDVMLDKDPSAQKLLETCLVRMPNQGLSMGDCRDILEFMRKNDNQK